MSIYLMKNAYIDLPPLGFCISQISGSKYVGDGSKAFFTHLPLLRIFCRYIGEDDGCENRPSADSA
jgi:hypothetical protein